MKMKEFFSRKKHNKIASHTFKKVCEKNKIPIWYWCQSVVKPIIIEFVKLVGILFGDLLFHNTLTVHWMMNIEWNEMSYKFKIYWINITFLVCRSHIHIIRKIVSFALIFLFRFVTITLLCLNFCNFFFVLLQ